MDIGNEEQMKIKAIRCPKCGDVIYSRARHDFHWCTCKLIGVDGGFDYTKYCIRLEEGRIDWVAPTSVLQIELEVDVTEKKLYKDWNLGINKYGIVRKIKED